MNFVIDVNLPSLWVDFLRSREHSALHWSEIGRHDADDTAILAWAVANDHTLMTSDLDYGFLLATSGAQKPSVVQLRMAITLPGYVGDLVLRAITNTELHLAEGALLTISAKRTRSRRLPFKIVM